MTRQGLLRKAVLACAGAAVLGGGALTGVHVTTFAHAAGTVARYNMTPTPIGTPSTVPVNTTVNVTVTAIDASGAAVPGTAVYIALDQVNGGGSAKVGTTALGRKAKPFTGDTSGRVVVAFTTPATFPTTGIDLLRVQNAATPATSTVKAEDSFDYTALTGLKYSANPIAPTHSLAASTTTQLTLAVTKGAGVAAPGATVYMSFRATTGGGTATANGAALTPTAAAVTADAMGLVHIAYRTPAVIPTSGSDVLVATDSAIHPALIARDRYTF